MRKGITLVELLIAMVIALLIIGAVYKVYSYFSQESAKQMVKAQALSQIKAAFRLLEDDIRHAGFGMPDRSFCKEKGICLFSVDNNCHKGDDFCKDGTDRFFVADGWEIIRDFTDDHMIDGFISDSDYKKLSNSLFYAKVISYVSGTRKITVDKLDIDNRSDGVKSEDIKDNRAVIICGRLNPSGRVGQEGRRLKSASGHEIQFLKKEDPLNYKYACSADCSDACEGIVLPAVVWYVKKADDGRYWLYRNEKRVIPDVFDFQIHVGYDLDGDGVVEDSEWINADSLPDDASPDRLHFFWFEIKAGYRWKGQIRHVNYTLRVDVKR
jgi:type II secretory pathway pseudopilin PulG